MSKTPNGWTILDKDAAVLTYEYTFAPGSTSNAFAARMKDGRMMVVSPPCRVGPEVAADLDAFGGVGAVVANNGFHHMGLPEWKRYAPDARFFADAQATKRIVKRNKDAPPLEDIAALTEHLGDDVVVTNLPNTKIGELWARARTSRGHVWYGSDVISNLPTMPDKFMIRMFFKMTGTKAGFGIFHTGLKFTVKDKAAVLKRLHEELSQDGACAIVPGHGPLLDEEGLATRAVQMVAAEL